MLFSKGGERGWGSGHLARAKKQREKWKERENKNSTLSRNEFRHQAENELLLSASVQG